MSGAGIVERIKPLLAGQPPEIQGGALAELLATWLGGQGAWLRRPADRRAFREDLLDRHIVVVRKLIKLKPADRQAPP